MSCVVLSGSIAHNSVHLWPAWIATPVSQRTAKPPPPPPHTTGPPPSCVVGVGVGVWMGGCYIYIYIYIICVHVYVGLCLFFVPFEFLLKFTHVVDSDTTVHDVHTYTVAFSPSVLIKCCICPSRQTLSRTP